MEDFINRSYTKKELGMMYFPESMPRTAVNHLMSWIRRCQPLWMNCSRWDMKRLASRSRPNR